LYLLGWHRIIIDEGHEVLSNSNRGTKPLPKDTWEGYQSNFRGMLLACTPLPFSQEIVMCKGSVHMRTRMQLSRFTSKEKDSARILLLSLSHSASGTRLANATHVLLIDPVVGSLEEAQVTDAQARALTDWAKSNPYVL
jgi:hypothetical protein